MSKIFYIADWHYGHANIINYDNRPFKDVKQMNQALIEQWNGVVSDEDTVYSLGDMFWCGSQEAQEVMDQLNGKIKLLKGNHCKLKDINLINKFDSVHDYLEIKDGEHDIVLSHYPIPTFKNCYRGWIHLYGHVHSSFEYNMIQKFSDQMKDLYMKDHHMYNVGCMMPWIGYFPTTLNNIMKGYDIDKKIRSGT